jgi:NADPH:quinone reductase-like Zn-dependent oxidoreductase
MLAAIRQKHVIASGDSSALAAESFRRLMSLAGEGRLRAVIETVLPFGQVIEAHRRVDGGHKVGSIVLAFDQAD